MLGSQAKAHRIRWLWSTWSAMCVQNWQVILNASPPLRTEISVDCFSILKSAKGTSLLFGSFWCFYLVSRFTAIQREKRERHFKWKPPKRVALLSRVSDERSICRAVIGLFSLPAYVVRQADRWAASLFSRSFLFIRHMNCKPNSFENLILINPISNDD